MGVEPPVYAQLPLILGADRKKLSKRNGDASVSDYRESGYLPEALFNFLGTLGWSLDDKTTLISREDFISHFSLERVGSSPAMWDMKKLDWMNGEYVREIPDDELLRDVTETLERDLPPEVPRPVDREVIALALPELRTRLKRMSDALPLMQPLFPEVTLQYEPDTLLGKAFAGDHDKAREALELLRERYEAVLDWTGETLLQVARDAAESMNLKFGDFFYPVRVAVSGQTVHLPIPAMMEILGKQETLRRLEQAALMLAIGA
jgi:glutamyl-tRNA synthetase